MMGSNGDGGHSSGAWPMAVLPYGPDSEEDDDSSKDGSMKGSGNGDDMRNGDDMGNGNGGSDAEGVWSPDIEQSFQEALAIYPPCGRRKIILSDEGKMYGRNELIARYIKLRTGKTRTRKQVSSHIQVLARRKAREVQGKTKAILPPPPSQVQLDNCSRTAIIGHSLHHQLMPFSLAKCQSTFHEASREGIKPLFINEKMSPISGGPISVNNNNNGNSWEGRTIASNKLRLSTFYAFMDHGPGTDKHIFVEIDCSRHSYYNPLLEDIDLRQISDKFPSNKTGLKDLYNKGPQNAFFLVKFWADLNIPSSMLDGISGAFYGVTSQFESQENLILNCSTKVCSFGKQVVEKMEVIEYPNYLNGRFVYRLDRSEMCEYLINFIHKLKDLPEKYMMNSVLENFTILQVISNRETQETLLCIAFVFEVSVSDNGAQYHVYRLTKPSSNNDNN